MAGVASRIRARLLELDETYVSGLIGALSRVGDVASVKPACRRFAAGAAGAGAPILGQGRDDGGDVSLTGAVGVSLAGETEGGEGSCSSSSSSSWDLMITPWTAQGFHAMDWGAELLGGRRGGLRSGKNGGDEAHDEGGVGSAGVRSMGRCEAVRIPKVRWEALDGIFIVLPMLEGNEETGGLEVMVGLERGVMERLKEMEEWREWAVWRCD